MSFPNSDPNAQRIKAASVALLFVGDLEKALGDCELLCLMKPLSCRGSTQSFLPLSLCVLRICCPCTVTMLSFLPPVLLQGSDPLIISTVRAVKLAPLQIKPISNTANLNTKAWRVLCLSLLQTSSNDARQHHVCPPPGAAFVSSNAYSLMP